MLGGIFGRKRQAATVTFVPGIGPEFRDQAKEAIVAGRYRVFAPAADGRATLLLGTTPRLIASAVRQAAAGGPEMLVEWLSEASGDPRDHPLADHFSLSCRAGEPSAGPD